MSQKKMEEYKKYKKNRKQIIEHEKRMKVVKPLVTCGVLVLIVALSCVGYYFATKKAEIKYMPNWTDFSENYQKMEKGRQARLKEEAADDEDPDADGEEAGDETDTGSGAGSGQDAADDKDTPDDGDNSGE